MTNIEIRFLVVVSPDKTSVGVFSGDIIGPDPLKAALERACAPSTNARVRYADWGMLPEAVGDATRYTFGTCGVIRFDAPQSDAALRDMQRAVAHELGVEGYTAIIQGMTTKAIIIRRRTTNPGTSSDVVMPTTKGPDLETKMRETLREADRARGHGQWADQDPEVWIGSKKIGTLPKGASDDIIERLVKEAIDAFNTL